MATEDNTNQEFELLDRLAAAIRIGAAHALNFADELEDPDLKAKFAAQAEASKEFGEAVMARVTDIGERLGKFFDDDDDKPSN